MSFAKDHIDGSKFFDRLYISTIAEDAVQTAKEYRLGLEIAEFCTADNMDREFHKWNTVVQQKMEGVTNFVFHAPFNELYPAAIDSLAVELAHHRYEQAYMLAKGYGINRMVVHSGYLPLIYHKEWFLEKSMKFWKSFLFHKPDNFIICLENVLEDDPQILIELADAINDPRMRLCLDIGHANIMSAVPLTDWVKRMSPVLGHVHLHNNFGDADLHNGLKEGNIDVGEILRLIINTPAEITCSIEALQSRESVSWLKNGLRFAVQNNKEVRL